MMSMMTETKSSIKSFSSSSSSSSSSSLSWSKRKKRKSEKQPQEKEEDENEGNKRPRRRQRFDCSFESDDQTKKRRNDNNKNKNNKNDEKEKKKKKKHQEELKNKDENEEKKKDEHDDDDDDEREDSLDLKNGNDNDDDDDGNVSITDVPRNVRPDHGTILLFYQYKEPSWTTGEHRSTFRYMMEMCREHRIRGRGRIAPEGLNCTLSSECPHDMRRFCRALCRRDPHLFSRTDFKLTDDVPPPELFRSLSLRPTTELVAYGMAGDRRAPSLKEFGGAHMDAADYHLALSDPDAVVIDVRNAYETSLGRLQPPPHGARRLDPQLRHSADFPRWLHDPATQRQLRNKTVLMYCTGGIRCERASALLNQMKAVQHDDANSIANANANDDANDDANAASSTSSSSPSSCCAAPKAVYELKGGIERYLRAFPDGGYWKGKNYLFDRRREQIPQHKSRRQVEAEISARCCLCRRPYPSYRGRYECHARAGGRSGGGGGKSGGDHHDDHHDDDDDDDENDDEKDGGGGGGGGGSANGSGRCGVPVVVCDACQDDAKRDPRRLRCELCRVGYRSPPLAPDLVRLKRRAEEAKRAAASMAISTSSAAFSSSSSSSSCGGDSSSQQQRPRRKEQRQQQQKKDGDRDAMDDDEEDKNKITHNSNGGGGGDDDDEDRHYDDRLFLSRLPLTATRTKLSEALDDPLVMVQWLTDVRTGAFYGSCIVQLKSTRRATDAVRRCGNGNGGGGGGIKVDKKRIRVSFVRKKKNTKKQNKKNPTTTSTRKEKRRRRQEGGGNDEDNDNSGGGDNDDDHHHDEKAGDGDGEEEPFYCWPPKNHVDREYPPIVGHVVSPSSYSSPSSAAVVALRS